MKNRQIERDCFEAGEQAMEFLIGVSNDLVVRGSLSLDDICVLHKVWDTISSIKTVHAMDAGANWLVGKR